jgi:hypothetical protein
MKPGRLAKPVIERLFNKTYIPSTPEGTKDDQQCWTWQGGINNAGYGMIRINKEEGMGTVHRIVEQHFRPFNSNLEVQHTCGNKLCVNPNHLTIGTVKSRRQVRPTGYDHWLMREGESLTKTCDVCEKTTHRLWFSRKHKKCK